ncbi:unnamed protein product [Effrenium voratum]|uniref:Uncharacterized protein n=1 Tax=Effrenium voratum TaxID=2562239 RepID=A0AA36MPP6_9DINO|nr:unnamed protein product [Effrenium voratum]
MTKRVLENGGDEALLKVKVKEPGERKAEAKEEAKEAKKEVKEEVKEEDEDEIADLLSQAPLEQLKGQKRKRKAAALEEDSLLPVPEVPDVETDSEYQELELSTYPKKLYIEACSYEKVNGLYRIMTQSSRGRPCYCKTTTAKNLYLYWYSARRWHIGLDFGSKKCIASVQDMGDLAPPFEPYPNGWKVMEKHHKDGGKEKLDKIKCPQMRVIDGEVYADAHVLTDIDQPLEISLAKRKEKKSPEKDKAESPERKASAKAKSSPPRASPKKGPELDDEAAMVEAAQQSDSDDESKVKDSQRSGSNASESESEESSSSESASEAEAPDEDYEAMSPATKHIVQKLKTMVPKEAATKAEKLFGSIRQKMRKGGSAPGGMSHTDVKHLAAWCHRHLGVAASLTRPEAAAPMLAEQPQTPPDKDPPRQSDTQMPHLYAQPSKSVLRPPGAPRPRQPRRVQYPADRHLKLEVPIESFKTYGEGLWFQCPGAMVNCDTCDRVIPQGLGSLQGAPSRSQFAQHLFLCSDCSR